MKRGGPLRRGKPLGRGKGLKRGGNLKRSKPLNATRVMAQNPTKRASEERYSGPGATGWTQRVFALYGRACLACPRKDPKPAVQAHHVVPKQRINRAAHLTPAERDALRYDARNGLPVCLDCHGSHENPGVAGRRILRARLLPAHIEWAEEHGFETTVNDGRLYK